MNKQYGDYIEDWVDEIIEEDEDKIKVDWEALERNYSEKREDCLLDRLRDLDVLSLESKGNYGLIGCGMLLNPRRYSSLYFTEKKYAEEYKRKYKNATYGVKLVEFL